MSDAVEIRLLTAADLPAYKVLRDDMLSSHPEAFTSDATEERAKEPTDYLHRLGLDRRERGQFVLGAWRGERLLGAIGCERDRRKKGRHVGHVVGMMVRPQVRRRGLGRDLLEALLGESRRTEGLEMLTLSVTAGNVAALRLYESAGFVTYGKLPRAIRLDNGRYHDKVHMVLTL